MKDKLKFILLLLSSIAVGFSYGGENVSLFTILFNSFSYIPAIVILLIIIFVDSLKEIRLLNNNYFLLCRINSLNYYIRHIVAIILKNNFYVISLYLILMIFSSSIFSFGNFTIPTYYININFLIILVYYILKFIILINVISVLFVIIYIAFGYRGIFIYSIYLASSIIYSVTYSKEFISSILSYSLSFIDYLKNIQYKPFIHDVISFILFITLNIFFIKLFKVKFINNRRDLI